MLMLLMEATPAIEPGYTVLQFQTRRTALSGLIALRGIFPLERRVHAGQSCPVPDRSVAFRVATGTRIARVKKRFQSGKEVACVVCCFSR
jgi:hypothetical protein